MNDKVQIPSSRYLELLKAEDELDALQCAGVDNWEGYGEHTEYRESEESLIEEVKARMCGTMTREQMIEEFASIGIALTWKMFGTTGGYYTSEGVYLGDDEVEMKCWLREEKAKRKKE